MQKNVVFRRFWVNEPHHSENISDENCYLHRSMCHLHQSFRRGANGAVANIAFSFLILGTWYVVKKLKSENHMFQVESPTHLHQSTFQRLR